MPQSIYELYGEIWGKPDEVMEKELETSLKPRPLSALYDYLSSFDITPEQLVLDIGSRDAKHAVEIVNRFGCRVEAVDPIPLHAEWAEEKVAAAGLAEQISIRTAGIELLPFEDGLFDHVWCRDMLNHVDLEKGLAECFRVLKAGGQMLIYQTFATPLMEANEAQRIYNAMSIVEQNMSPAYFESVAKRAGFSIEKKEIISSEWRENSVEAGDQSMLKDLLFTARIQRRKAELVAKYGAEKVETAYADSVWGIYQMLGKLNPSIYVLRKAES